MIILQALLCISLIIVDLLYFLRMGDAYFRWYNSCFIFLMHYQRFSHTLVMIKQKDRRSTASCSWESTEAGTRSLDYKRAINPIIWCCIFHSWSVSFQLVQNWEHGDCFMIYHLWCIAMYELLLSIEVSLSQTVDVYVSFYL